MNEKSTSKYTENDDFLLNSEECDYKNLISRLKEISATISFLEKQYLDKL